MNELYRSDNVVVRCVPADDQSRWVITFDNYGIGHGFDRQGFGEVWLQSRGISAIHVMGKYEDWYQYPDMADAMAAVRGAVSGADRVMTYGSSMGAYAAIRFADAAGANAVLALSPQYSIDPVKKPRDSRWQQDSHRIKWLPSVDGVIQCSCVPVVVYDTKNADALHADMIAQDISITRVRVPYSAHPTTTFLSEVGLLHTLVFDVLAGTLDAPSMEAATWDQRKSSVVYLGELVERQRHLRPRMALRLARKGTELAVNNTYALSTLAKQLSLSGEHREALAVHRQILELGGRSPVFLLGYGHDLMAVGDVDGALAVAREIISLMPYMAHLQSWSANVYWVAGYKGEAVKAATAAAALDRSNAHYRKMLVKYRYGDLAAAMWRLKTRFSERALALRPTKSPANEHLSRHDSYFASGPR